MASSEGRTFRRSGGQEGLDSAYHFFSLLPKGEMKRASNSPWNGYADTIRLIGEMHIEIGL